MSESSSVKNHGIDINGMSPLETAGMAISKAADPFGVTSSLLNAQMAWMMHPQELMRAAFVGAGSTRHPFIFYFIAAVVYLVITLVSQGGFDRIERLLRPRTRT